MGTRRDSRVQALKILFYNDMSKYDISLNLKLFCNFFNDKNNIEQFSLRIVNGVCKYKDEVDTIIRNHSSNWKMHRISYVDRNILRIAVFEMIYCEDIPDKVSINEAIDLGKRFGTEESGTFINGILGSIYSEILVGLGGIN